MGRRSPMQRRRRRCCRHNRPRRLGGRPRRVRVGIAHTKNRYGGIPGRATTAASPSAAVTAAAAVVADPDQIAARRVIGELARIGGCCGAGMALNTVLSVSTTLSVGEIVKGSYLVHAIGGAGRPASAPLGHHHAVYSDGTPRTGRGKKPTVRCRWRGAY